MNYYDEKKLTKLSYLVSHPIQYQAPLLKIISNQESIDLTAIFRSDISTGQFFDKEFGLSMKWDTPMLDGYNYVFLRSIGSSHKFTFFRPINFGLLSILFKRKIDILWIHGWGSWFQIYAIFIARILGIKVFIRGESNLKITISKGLKGVIKRIFLRILFRMVNCFLAIGTLNRDYYKSYGVKDDIIFMVPYVVDNKFFQQASKLPEDAKEKLRHEHVLDSNRKVILFASKMIARKRAIDLLQAYFLLSDKCEFQSMPYLLFVGDGESREQLELLSRKHSCSELIRYLGFKNQTELPKYFGLCDVFVLPSEDEPWGLIVNEAMNAGIPIIVSDQVGCGPDLVKHGSNGFIFETGNYHQLASYLDLLLLQPCSAESFGVKSIGAINQWGYDEDILGINKAINYIYRSKYEI
jgi:glycosyltransferase involved in cell wall biosynthesis